MAKYRLYYKTSVEVEADSEDEAREMTCCPQAEEELIMNLKETDIKRVKE